jgi:uncharacterized LabA/DUF88 family protein
MPNIRTVFFIDGFNLYHSAVDANNYLGGSSTKWLNIYSLCQSYLHLFGINACLSNIIYFSALATHLQASNPGKIKRHKDYIECLKSVGINVILSSFKEKPFTCYNCGNKIRSHEEKETAVAIAVKLFELLINDKLDIAVIVTGDTDLTPAVITAKSLFPSKKFIFAFPYLRKNNSLARIAPGSFSIKPKHYVINQFPDPVILPNGRKIPKPVSW